MSTDSTAMDDSPFSRIARLGERLTGSECLSGAEQESSPTWPGF
jgi:hypothetical protein